MKHPDYVATLSHYSSDGDEHTLMSATICGPVPLRRLRTAMKRLARQSGLSYSLAVWPDAPKRRIKEATDHYFRCLAGQGRRRRVRR